MGLVQRQGRQGRQGTAERQEVAERKRRQRSYTRPLKLAGEAARAYLQQSCLKSRLDRAGHAAMTVAAALAALLAGGCRDAITASPSPPPSTLAGETDITLFVAADTHFGARGMEELNRLQVEGMHSLPGEAYPAKGLGAIVEPRAVLMAGDLTDHGRSDEWEQFVACYGLSGGDGMLKWPVQESTGNHDRPYFGGRRIASAVANRQGGLPYSRQWQALRVICLDVYPNAANREFLRAELERVGRQAPVLIYFHYGLAGPYSDWWSEKEKLAFGRIIDGHNVVGIFHGHFHATAHYKWQGFDVYNVGSVRHGWHSFCVVRVTDDYMFCGSWNFAARQWDWWHVKPVGNSSKISESDDMPLIRAMRDAAGTGAR